MCMLPQFDSEEFKEFAAPVLQCVLELIGRTTLGASNLTVMSVLSLLIERIGDQIHAFAPQVGPSAPAQLGTAVMNTTCCVPQVAQCLPAVWTSTFNSDDNSSTMVKSRVVVAANHLTVALGSDAVVLFDFTIPMIQHCIDMTHLDHVYLLEVCFNVTGMCHLQKQTFLCALSARTVCNCGYQHYRMRLVSHRLCWRYTRTLHKLLAVTSIIC